MTKQQLRENIFKELSGAGGTDDLFLFVIDRTIESLKESLDLEKVEISLMDHRAKTRPYFEGINKGKQQIKQAIKDWEGEG